MGISVCSSGDFQHGPSHHGKVKPSGGKYPRGRYSGKQPLTFPWWEAPSDDAPDRTKEALVQIHIQNMTCGGCVRGVTRAIHSVDPKAGIEADPPSRKVNVQSDRPGTDFLPALEAAGFAARLF
jgi:copper chaperone